MPLPTPNSGEEESKFVGRCVSAVFEDGMLNGKPVSKDSADDRKQAAAVCYSQWRKGKSDVVNKREWTAEMRKKLKEGQMEGEFAGPDESFPIASPEDVHAAYMSAGRAGGDPEKIRQAVIRIAKKHGWESGLPASVKEKKKSVALPGVITKAQVMPDGRVKWRARVNSGNFDDQGERFDRSYFEELVKNFAIQQEALYHGKPFPIEAVLDDGFILMMNEPIQDIAHYSYFIDEREKARTGYPTKLWLDGDALMSEGYYDNSPLGKLASQAALAERDIEKRRMSIGTYPDWGLVEELADGRRVFKGGRGRAWLDHEAVTSCPVDADTEIVTLSEVNMATQKEDALTVLGSEAEELIDGLEAAKVKSGADEVVLKTEGEEDKEEKEDKTEEEAKKEEAELEVESVADPVLESKVEAAMKSFITDFMPKFGEKVIERIDATIKSQVGDRLDRLEAKVEAVAADETVKLQAALDHPENWMDNLVEKSLSVRHGSDEAVVKGEAKVKGVPADDFAKTWGNPED